MERIWKSFSLSRGDLPLVIIRADRSRKMIFIICMCKKWFCSFATRMAGFRFHSLIINIGTTRRDFLFANNDSFYQVVGFNMSTFIIRRQLPNKVARDLKDLREGENSSKNLKSFHTSRHA